MKVAARIGKGTHVRGCCPRASPTRVRTAAKDGMHALVRYRILAVDFVHPSHLVILI